MIRWGLGRRLSPSGRQGPNNRTRPSSSSTSSSSTSLGSSSTKCRRERTERRVGGVQRARAEGDDHVPRGVLPGARKNLLQLRGGENGGRESGGRTATTSWAAPSEEECPFQWRPCQGADRMRYCCNRCPVSGTFALLNSDPAARVVRGACGGRRWPVSVSERGLLRLAEGITSPTREHELAVRRKSDGIRHCFFSPLVFRRGYERMRDWIGIGFGCGQ